MRNKMQESQIQHTPVSDITLESLHVVDCVKRDLRLLLEHLHGLVESIFLQKLEDELDHAAK